MMKYLFLSLALFLLLLQPNSILLKSVNGQSNIVTIEFRKINSVQLDQALSGNHIEGYTVMFCENEPAGYDETIPKLVSKNTEVLITGNDILKIYAVNKKFGIWIYFVFNKELVSDEFHLIISSLF